MNFQTHNKHNFFILNTNKYSEQYKNKNENSVII